MKLRWYDEESGLIEMYNEHKHKPRLILKYDPEISDTCEDCEYYEKCTNSGRGIFMLCNLIASKCQYEDLGVDISRTTLFDIK